MSKLYYIQPAEGCLFKLAPRTPKGRPSYEVYDGRARLIGRFTSERAAIRAFFKIKAKP